MSRTIFDAREIAEKTLKSIGLFDQTVDSFEVARRLGYELQLRWPFHGEVSGLSIKDPDLCLIYLSDSEKYTRKQFSCAHEIGHLLDPTIPSCKGITTSQVTLEQETFADWVAAEIKMPEYWVRMLVKTFGVQPGLLAHCMKVTDPAMVKRLTELGYTVDTSSLKVKSRDLWVFGRPDFTPRFRPRF